MKIGDIPVSKLVHTKEGEYAFHLLHVFIATGLHIARHTLRWATTAH
jgi:hypothetical protein